MKKILDSEDSKQFRSKRVKISRDNNGTKIQILEPEMSFPDMMKCRTQHKSNAQGIFEGLTTTGYDFANIGVSGILTINLEGNDYLVTVRQDRQDFGDCVVKLVSGYVEARDLRDPSATLKREVSEEVLPITPTGKLIRFRHRKKMLPRPYSDHFQDFPTLIDLEYPARFNILGLEGTLVSVNGQPLEESVGLYSHVPFNCAQLVFSYHLGLGSLDLKQMRVSLHHTEDTLNRENGILEKILHLLGISLIKIENGELTDRVCNFSNGELTAIDPRTIKLSEAFAQKSQGIIEAKNIPLIDYLKRK